MAFNDSPGRAEYIASGGQTIFPFNFKIYQDEDIKVYLTPSGQTPDDNTDLLMLINDYTVAINGDLGGTMTLVTPATSGDAVTIIRELSITRLVDYQTGGDLLATTLNLDQNYQTYLVADGAAAQTRYISIPDSSQGVSTDLPDVAPDAYLKWNSAGDALENDTTIPDNVINSEDSNLEAGSWANENEDVPVKEYTAGVPSDRSPTVFSSKHHSLKSTASATASANSATSSEDSNLEAGSWANEDENVPVKEYTNGVPSDRSPEVFSAKHYATKATSGGTARTSVRNSVISSPNGVLALATTPTPSFNTVIYTGNGTSQNIVTGLDSTDPNWISAGYYTLDQYIVYDYVIYQALTTHSGVATTPDADGTNWSAIGANVHIPFNNSKVWIKGRGSVSNNIITSTLQGVQTSLLSDTTGAEVTGQAVGLLSFNNDGFTLGGGGNYNANTATYVTWQTQYDSMFYGTTNQGKKFVTAYNAQSGEGMTIYVGSGTAGHEIPHGLGTEIDYIDVKGRTNVFNWQTFDSDTGGTGFTNLNTNLAITTNVGAWNDTNPTEAVFTLGTFNQANQLDDSFVAYFSSNRTNHTFTGQYTGTGSAGNVVDFGIDMTQAGAKVMIKRLDSTGSWAIMDNARANDGNPLYANLSDAEDTINDFTDFTTTGVTIVSTNTGVNASGGQYLITAVVPNHDKPNGGIDVNADSVISYAEGTDGTTGDLDSIETTIGASDVTMELAENIITYSEELNNADWLINSITVTANDAIAPDGTLTADLLTVGGTDGRLTQSFTTEIGVPITFSIYVKQKIGDLATLRHFTSEDSFSTMSFTFSSKSISLEGNSINGSYEDVGDGWFRISYTISTITGVTSQQIQLSRNNTNSEVYYWGAQLEKGTLSPYIKTEDSTATAVSTKNYLFINKGNTYGATKSPPTKTTNFVTSDGSDTYDVAEGIMYNTSNTQISRVYLGEVVADGEGLVIPDTLVEYPVAHLDVASLEVHGDTVLHGDVSGKNICTAWVNFDGTTTPPTIRDRYNVSDVVRTSTGLYDIYFNVPMDTINYATVGMGSDSTDRTIITIEDTQLSKVAVRSVFDSATQVDTNGTIIIFGGKN